MYVKVTNKIDLLAREPERFTPMLSIANDLVTLYFTIVSTASQLWLGVDESASHGRTAGLPFLDHPKSAMPVPWLDDVDDVAEPMKYAAALVMMSAFRYFVEVDSPSGSLRWRSDFDEVLAAWDLSLIHI